MHHYKPILLSSFVIKILEKLPSWIYGVPKLKSYILNYLPHKGSSYAIFPDGKKLLVDLNNCSEIPLWIGCYPQNVFTFLRRNLESNSYFIDCGANIGVWSLLALNVIKDENGGVLSFEPNPALYERLLHSKGINNLDLNWKVFDSALSNFNGKGVIYIDDGTHQFSSLTKQNIYTRSLNINCIKLDDIEGLEKIDGIKIDVEGHELEIIQGATNKISSSKPWLVVEFNSSYTKTNSVKEWKVSQFLYGLGYETNHRNLTYHSLPFCKDIIFYHPYRHDPSSFYDLS